MTLKEIEDSLIAKCNTLNLSGVISTSVAKLLAYAIYIDNANANSKILNSVFSSATNLNNSLTHACNLLYSTYRGETSKVTYTNIMAGKTAEYKYLDPAFQYNGKYYYYDRDYDVTATTLNTVSYYSSDKPLLECVAKAEKESYQFIDFTAANVSEAVVLYGVDASGNETRLTWTDSAYDFFKNEKLSDNSYVYQYLMITNTSYGVRILKRYNETNANSEVTWMYPSYKIKYIPYSEFIPDLRSLRSLGDFSYIENTGVLTQLQYTTLTATKFKAREENPEVIYMQATKYFMTRNQIGSITDIEYIIQSHGDNSEVIYNIVPRIDTAGQDVTGYDVYARLESKVLALISSEIKSRNPPFTVEVSPMSAVEITITYTTTGTDYYTEVDLNEHFTPLWRANRSMTIAEMTAEILRYDTGMDSCTLIYSGWEEKVEGESEPIIHTDTLVPLGNNEYYEITLAKKGATS